MSVWPGTRITWVTTSGLKAWGISQLLQSVLSCVSAGPSEARSREDCPCFLVFNVGYSRSGGALASWFLMVRLWSSTGLLSKAR